MWIDQTNVQYCFLIDAGRWFNQSKFLLWYSIVRFLFCFMHCYCFINIYVKLLFCSIYCFCLVHCFINIYPLFQITAQLNSEALLRLCIKRTRGLDKVALLKADFEPTEPHSLRLIVAVCCSFFKIAKRINKCSLLIRLNELINFKNS